MGRIGLACYDCKKKLRVQNANRVECRSREMIECRYVCDTCLGDYVIGLTVDGMRIYNITRK